MIMDEVIKRDLPGTNAGAHAMSRAVGDSSSTAYFTLSMNCASLSDSTSLMDGT